MSIGGATGTFRNRKVRTGGRRVTAGNANMVPVGHMRTSTTSSLRSTKARQQQHEDRYTGPGGEAAPMSARTPEAEPLLTPAEVATMFRVDPKTVTRWAKAGKLTSIRTLGGHRRYRETEVRALLAGIPQQRSE